MNPEPKLTTVCSPCCYITSTGAMHLLKVSLLIVASLKLINNCNRPLNVPLSPSGHLKGHSSGLLIENFSVTPVSVGTIYSRLHDKMQPMLTIKHSYIA